MAEVPILDRARLELITRGDAALADEFLRALIDEADAMFERLRALLMSDDRGAVAAVAHTVKGGAAELGVMRLREAAAALEAETQPARWPDRLDALATALAQLRTLIGST